MSSEVITIGSDIVTFIDGKFAGARSLEWRVAYWTPESLRLNYHGTCYRIYSEDSWADFRDVCAEEFFRTVQERMTREEILLDSIVSPDAQEVAINAEIELAQRAAAKASQIANVAAHIAKLQEMIADADAERAQIRQAIADGDARPYDLTDFEDFVAETKAEIEDWQKNLQRLKGANA